MKKENLGSTDMKVSQLGWGGVAISLEKSSFRDVEKLLNTALDDGLNVIDTAPCYSNSEEFIGRSVAHRRDEYYLMTKCGHAAGVDLLDWSPELVEYSIDRSLNLLKTDYIDVVSLHTCPETILRHGDLIMLLQKIKDAGKVRYIGYSGDSNAAAYAVRCGHFDILQTSINIADQEAIDLTIPTAVKKGMGVIAKRPIANIAWSYNEEPKDPYYHDYWRRFHQLDYGFLKGQLSDAVNIALRFTISVPGVSTAIVGTSSCQNWHQNKEFVEAGNLSGEQFDGIRNIWKSISKQSWPGRR